MPTRNSPCNCGSGKRFKHCCGAPAVKSANAVPSQGSSPYAKFGDFQGRYRGRGMLPYVEDMPPGVASKLDWVPPGLMVLDDFLDGATCDRWTDYLRKQKSAPVKIQKVNNVVPGSGPQFELDERRITERVPLGSLEDEIKSVVYGAYREEILPYFGKSLDWVDSPDVLKYLPGGKYIVHSDSEYWDMAARRWVRSMDRDISVLIYTNDEFEGGNLYFHNFDIRIKPSRGMLVAFPSDHRYMHAAETLISGSRFVVTCWSSIKGVSKVNPEPPGVIRL